jgi:hypothetical protein
VSKKAESSKLEDASSVAEKKSSSMAPHDDLKSESSEIQFSSANLHQHLENIEEVKESVDNSSSK